MAAVKNIDSQILGQRVGPMPSPVMKVSTPCTCEPDSNHPLPRPSRRRFFGKWPGRLVAELLARGPRPAANTASTQRGRRLDLVCRSNELSLQEEKGTKFLEAKGGAELCVNAQTRVGVQWQVRTVSRQIVIEAAGVEVHAALPVKGNELVTRTIHDER